MSGDPDDLIINDLHRRCEAQNTDFWLRARELAQRLLAKKAEVGRRRVGGCWLGRPADLGASGGFWAHGRQEVHDRGCHCAAHAEVQDGDVFGSGRLHGQVLAGDRHSEPVGKELDSMGEVREQDVVPKRLQWSARVPGQPVLYDLGFGLHGQLEPPLNFILLSGHDRQFESALPTPQVHSPRLFNPFHVLHH